MIFLNDTATTEIYTLSLHDALPISGDGRTEFLFRNTRKEVSLYTSQAGTMPIGARTLLFDAVEGAEMAQDRKSTRLNSSHANISYAVFCLKKKTQNPAASPCTPIRG